jgi:hypothetical protein
VPGRCTEERPELYEIGRDHRTACFFPELVGSLVVEP